MVKEFYLTQRLDPIICYQSGSEWTWSNGNEGVFYILQSSRAGTSWSNRLMPYPGHLLVGVCPSTEMQSVYIAPANWAVRHLDNMICIYIYIYIYIYMVLIMHINKYITSNLQWSVRRLYYITRNMMIHLGLVASPFGQRLWEYSPKCRFIRHFT